MVPTEYELSSPLFLTTFGHRSSDSEGGSKRLSNIPTTLRSFARASIYGQGRSQLFATDIIYFGASETRLSRRGFVSYPFTIVLSASGISEKPTRTPYILAMMHVTVGMYLTFFQGPLCRESYSTYCIAQKQV